MKHSFLDGRIQLFNADCVSYLKTLSDNSIDVVVTDPPYFQVKKNAWDNQWPDVESFLISSLVQVLQVKPVSN